MIIINIYKILITEDIKFKNKKRAKVNFIQTLYPVIHVLVEKRKKLIEAYENGYGDETLLPLVNRINAKIRMWLKRCNLPDYIIAYEYEYNGKLFVKEVFTDEFIYIDRNTEIEVCEDLMDAIEDYTLNQIKTIISNVQLIKSGFISDHKIFEEKDNILPFNILLRR